ncbi:sugar transferase [Pontibacillus salicampi]|uniref:Sugar transferase n=1 Tax=Pontibacillus salicampi TaxID=1449801 RepID=A0ABV6LSY5_9BACI
MKNNKIELSRSYEIVQRFFDILQALIGLIIAIPIIVISSIAIKVDTRGSIFYRQDRVGKNGQIFQIIKLRTMDMHAESSEPRWAGVNDPRVTKVGRFLRKTRIDELPQLINVLKGDMSIIGPRPERPFFTEKFNKENPGFIDRIVVKPGLTGLAQVNGGYDISPQEKLAYDLKYIRERTFLLDVKILFLTFKVVITGDGAR